MKIAYIYEVSTFDTAPVATVVSRINGNSLEYGVSWYNPKDKYDKKLGLKVATDKLLSEDFSKVNISETRHLEHTELMLRILMSIYISNEYPFSRENVLLGNILEYSSRTKHYD